MSKKKQPTHQELLEAFVIALYYHVDNIFAPKPISSLEEAKEILAQKYNGCTEILRENTEFEPQEFMDAWNKAHEEFMATGNKT